MRSRRRSAHLRATCGIHRSMTWTSSTSRGMVRRTRDAPRLCPGQEGSPYRRRGRDSWLGRGAGVGGRAVDRGDRAAHGADVGGELGAVVDLSVCADTLVSGEPLHGGRTAVPAPSASKSRPRHPGGDWIVRGAVIAVTPCCSSSSSPGPSRWPYRHCGPGRVRVQHVKQIRHPCRETPAPTPGFPAQYDKLLVYKALHG